MLWLEDVQNKMEMIWKQSLYVCKQMNGSTAYDGSGFLIQQGWSSTVVRHYILFYTMYVLID